MAITPTYPGVYLQEIPSGVRTITGVATSIAAFIDFFKRGPMNKAVQIFNMGDFEREFGGLDPRSEASYAVQQFFLNEGTEAWIVRTASDVEEDEDTPELEANEVTAADVVIQSGTVAPFQTALTVTAINPGVWGNNLRVNIDYPMPISNDRFNLTIFLLETQNGRPVVVRSEVFHNLSMTSGTPDFVDTVINDELTGSKLVRVEAFDVVPPALPVRPLQTGTLSGDLSNFLGLTPPDPADPQFHHQLNVTIGTEEGTAVLSSAPETLAQARTLLESAIRAARPELRAFAEASVTVVDNRLRILAGPTDSSALVTFGPTADDPVGFDPADPTGTVGELLLINPDPPPPDPVVQANVQAYTLGAGAEIADTAQGAGTGGADGVPPDPLALIGDLNAKTGMHALEDVDLFNILCIPRTAVVTSTDPVLNPPLDQDEAFAVIAAALTYCEKRRAFFIMDTPTNIDEGQEIREWLDDNATLRHKNAALYFPRVKIPDPLNGFKLRSVGASGTIAGLYARTDAARGVWKAPAGTEATLRNVAQLDDVLTDSENGALNPLGINCLRTFPIYGNICWGARTLEGADQIASEWKYIPVRRLALFLEESLFRGSKWVVFEPNDEPLWSQIRLNIGAFMQQLFRQGAFQGKTPQEAYFVKCDKETTTQADINNGIVNIVIGFAPLKPAEFVIIKIQQMAGQIQT